MSAGSRFIANPPPFLCANYPPLAVTRQARDSTGPCRDDLVLETQRLSWRRHQAYKAGSKAYAFEK